MCVQDQAWSLEILQAGLSRLGPCPRYTKQLMSGGWRGWRQDSSGWVYGPSWTWGLDMAWVGQGLMDSAGQVDTQNVCPRLNWSLEQFRSGSPDFSLVCLFFNMSTYSYTLYSWCCLGCLTGFSWLCSYLHLILGLKIQLLYILFLKIFT